MKKTFLFLSLAGLIFSANAQDISEKNIKNHIQTLADDKMLGRGTSEQGEKLAADYISKEFKKIGLKPAGDSAYIAPFKFTFKKYKENNPHAELESSEERIGWNVVGYLDNGAPYTIIIGAHYDHLGTGELGSSLDPEPKGKIHNGADDNASGVAGVIELARYFTSNKIKENCNFLFLCFSGEELGLYGSKSFAENSSFDPKKIQLMINMDMIGRLDSKEKKLMVYGIGTSPSLPELVNNFKPADFNLVLDSSGMGPSDHTSFYLKDIPVLAFFTGQHSEYHKPEDDADKINFKGEKEILVYVAQIADAASKKEKLSFTPTKSKDMGRTKFKVTLGIMPDYMFTGAGVKVDGVKEDKPAKNAGIQKGDIIKSLGGIEITDINVYMECLGKFEPGETVEAVIERDGQIMTMVLVL